jgi:hypothetical protein
VIGSIIRYPAPLIIEINTDGIVIRNVTLINASLVVLIAILLGVIITYIYENDLALKLTNKLGLSVKLSGTVWEKTLKKYRYKWVRVYINKNEYYIGWMEYFSLKEEEPSIFLRDIKHYQKPAGDKLFQKLDQHSGNGILLRGSIERVEIYNIENDKKQKGGNNEI